MLQRRPRDDDRQTGLRDWPFVSVQYWGENPKGKWKLTVALKGINREIAKMTKWKLGNDLIVFGEMTTFGESITFGESVIFS